MKNHSLIFVICLLVITAVGGLGCARTVTQYYTYGTQAVVEITLNGASDITNNRYFMVWSSNRNFKVPLPLPDNINSDEFLEPGMVPRVGSIEALYTTYYSTWNGFIAIDSGGYFVIQGPFVQGQAITREVLATPSAASTKLSFTVRLEQIFGATVPDTVYFDVVSVPWPANSTKLPADHLISTNATISKITGSTTTVVDDVEPSITDSANIIKCTVTIQ